MAFMFPLPPGMWMARLWPWRCNTAAWPFLLFRGGPCGRKLCGQSALCVWIFVHVNIHMTQLALFW